MPALDTNSPNFLAAVSVGKSWIKPTSIGLQMTVCAKTSVARKSTLNPAVRSNEIKQEGVKPQIKFP
jgi:hypothetical protein